MCLRVRVMIGTEEEGREGGRAGGRAGGDVVFSLLSPLACKKFHHLLLVRAAFEFFCIIPLIGFSLTPSLPPSLIL